MMLPLHIGEDRAKDNLGKVSKKMGSVKNFLSHSLKLKFQYFLQTLHVRSNITVIALSELIKTSITKHVTEHLM